MLIWMVVIILGLLAWLYMHGSGDKLPEFPGPRAWPILGNLLQIDSNNMHLSLMELAKKHGGVFKLTLLGEQLLVVTDPEIMRDTLVKRGNDFADRPVTPELWVYSQGGRGIVLSHPNATWKLLRKLSHATIKMYDRGMERIEAISLKMIYQMMDTFCGKAGRPVDPHLYITLATMNITSLFMVGRSYEKESDFVTAYIRLEEIAQDVASRRISGLFMQKLGWIKPYFDLLSGPGQEMKAAAEDMYARISAESMHSEEEGFTDSLGSVFRRAVQAGDITEKDAAAACVDLITAGSATTTNTMHGFLNVIVHYPDVQRKIHAEITDVMGERPVTLGDRDSMPYVMATLLEILRFTTILPLGVPHLTTKDTNISGKPVPAGTTLFFNLFALNHDATYFAEPYKFKPDRYLDESGRLVSADHPNRRNMMTFSAGPRGCFGEVFAKSRMFLLLVSLLQRFDIRADASGDVVSADPREYKAGATLLPPRVKLCFINRLKE